MELIVRHDIKSPLNSIIGFSDILLHDDTLSKKHKKDVKIIWNGGINALHMINLSLGLYRMETGAYQLEAKDLNLLPIIHNVQADSNTLLLDNQQTLTIEINGQPTTQTDSFFVYAEQMLCYSMLANLIKNAIEASPKGQSVTITLQDVDGMGVISIHNQGAIPEQIRDRFFEKYATAGKSSGTGLGTYSAKLIAQTQGGDIQMTSSEMAGTKISITIPMGKSVQTLDIRMRAKPRAKKREWVGKKRQAVKQTLIREPNSEADQETVANLVALFLDQAPQHMKALKKALENPTPDHAVKEIAWLKSMASDIGIARFPSQSIRLKGKVEMEDWDDARQAFLKLENSFQQAIQALQNKDRK